MKANIVLGLGYGDEGKGITTDFLCSQNPNSIVIRFSGGQQAGHTVKIGDMKHIFSNFGAGSLRGVPTYFTEHTTAYPTTIYREWKKLQRVGLHPSLVLHPLTRITTPFDVYANRQDTKNVADGTCGLGIGKTMSRNNTTPYKLYAIDLLNHSMLQQKMAAIGEYYGFTDVPGYMKDDMEDFMFALHEFPFQIQNYNYLRQFHNLIFEGSQGILLDMDHGIFPNVTYANTTSKNAHAVCDILGIDWRMVWYVTRSYHTRHGAGYFPNTPIEIFNNAEEINVNNEWQKEFKTGKLDYDLVNHAMNIDNTYCPQSTQFSLVVTCCDQVRDSFNYDMLESAKSNFVYLYQSHSPDSKDFINMKT